MIDYKATLAYKEKKRARYHARRWRKLTGNRKLPGEKPPEAKFKHMKFSALHLFHTISEAAFPYLTYAELLMLYPDRPRLVRKLNYLIDNGYVLHSIQGHIYPTIKGWNYYRPDTSLPPPPAPYDPLEGLMEIILSYRWILPADAVQRAEFIYLTERDPDLHPHIDLPETRTTRRPPWIKS
jgi:hypothetical protein